MLPVQLGFKIAGNNKRKRELGPFGRNYSLKKDLYKLIGLKYSHSLGHKGLRFKADNLINEVKYSMTYLKCKRNNRIYRYIQKSLLGI